MKKQSDNKVDRYKDEDRRRNVLIDMPTNEYEAKLCAKLMSPCFDLASLSPCIVFI